MAAVLSCGEGAILSHHSAAAMWGLRPASPLAGIDVTITGANKGVRPSIRLHRRPDCQPPTSRDGELHHAGYQVMRVVWRALEQEPEAVLVQVASVRAQSFSKPSPSSGIVS